MLQPRERGRVRERMAVEVQAPRDRHVWKLVQAVCQRMVSTIIRVAVGDIQWMAIFPLHLLAKRYEFTTFTWPIKRYPPLSHTGLFPVDTASPSHRAGGTVPVCTTEFQLQKHDDRFRCECTASR